VVGGPTAVISPLIALQQDQLEAVDEDAAVLNSTLTEKQREEVLGRSRRGTRSSSCFLPQSSWRTRRYRCARGAIPGARSPLPPRRCPTCR